MDRNQKEACVQHLRSVAQDSTVIVLATYKGLSVSEMTQLRCDLRQEGARFEVVKNKLLMHAVQGGGLQEVCSFMEGPTAMGYSEDPVAAPRVLARFAKKNEALKIRGGILGGKLLNASEMLALAELPSLDELRGKLVGLLQAPASQLARVLLEPAGQLARVLSARGRG